MRKPNPIPELSEMDITQFWAKVAITTINKCWDWRGTGRFFSKGYGKVWKNGHHWQAHRIAWFLHNRRQPGNFPVCHHCDNPRCCNPYHLFLDSQSGNIHDMYQKERGVNNKGEHHGMAKFLTADVLRIRQLHDLGYSNTKIAKEFKINQSTVSRIVNYLRWSHL